MNIESRGAVHSPFKRMLKECLFQPLLAVTTSKGYKIKEVLALNSPENTRLKCFLEKSSWLHDNCKSYVRQLTMNKIVLNDNKSIFVTKKEGTNASECIVESHEDSIFCFMGVEEQIFNSQCNDNTKSNKECNVTNNYAGSQNLFCSPSEKIALFNILNAFADQIA